MSESVCLGNIDYSYGVAALFLMKVLLLRTAVLSSKILPPVYLNKLFGMLASEPMSVSALLDGLRSGLPSNMELMMTSKLCTIIQADTLLLLNRNFSPSLCYFHT